LPAEAEGESAAAAVEGDESSTKQGTVSTPYASISGAQAARRSSAVTSTTLSHAPWASRARCTSGARLRQRAQRGDEKKTSDGDDDDEGEGAAFVAFAAARGVAGGWGRARARARASRSSLSWWG
jgi:hypothetical protein